jgi:hypothetical protein
VGIKTPLLVCALICAVFAASAVNAQIYTCMGPDGTRIFSDKKCGQDAKTVKGFEKTNSNSNRNNAPKTKAPVETKSPEELAFLLQRCNSGEQKSCMTWTMSGGPAALRDAERKAELACEAGSLADCEERFCKEGATEKCRQSVQRTADVTGDTWYLRSTREREIGGALLHEIRCIVKDQTKMRDAVVTCVNESPRFCYVGNPEQRFADLNITASTHCSVQ